MRLIGVVFGLAFGLTLVGCGSADPAVPSNPDSAETSGPSESQTPGENMDETGGQDDNLNESDTSVENNGEDESAEPRLPSTGDAYRDTAQEFALDVVQTYFDEDAERFESLVHDPLYLAGTNTVYTRAEYLEMMLDPVQFPAGHDLTAYTMTDYLSIYDPGVYTFQEASENFGLPLFDEDGWVPADDEFLFVGFFRQEGVPYTEEFIAVGLVMFVVAERDGAWKIVGLIPHP